MSTIAWWGTLRRPSRRLWNRDSRGILNPILMLLRIDERQIEPDITLVELTGKLALGRESQRIESLVDELAQRGAIKVVLDMSKVDYIDSAGIGLVALAAGKLKEVGGRVVVVAAEGRVL